MIFPFPFDTRPTYQLMDEQSFEAGEQFGAYEERLAIMEEIQPMLNRSKYEGMKEIAENYASAAQKTVDELTAREEPAWWNIIGKYIRYREEKFLANYINAFGAKLLEGKNNAEIEDRSSR